MFVGLWKKTFLRLGCRKCDCESVIEDQQEGWTLQIVTDTCHSLSFVMTALTMSPSPRSVVTECHVGSIEASLAVSCCASQPFLPVKRMFLNLCGNTVSCSVLWSVTFPWLGTPSQSLFSQLDSGSETKKKLIELGVSGFCFVCLFGVFFSLKLHSCVNFKVFNFMGDLTQSWVHL